PFDRVLDAVIEEKGFSGRPDRVALAGFSQGAIMALDLVASGRRPIGAVVAFSGRLATPPPWRPLQTPVLLAHGDLDSVIGQDEGRAAAEALANHGVDVEWLPLKGVGHALHPPGAEAALRFIADRLRLG
ncbi:hypothetical protein LTR94_025757, partial [Friedmanniomyces endolithicus]